jgi:hypothetical protein
LQKSLSWTPWLLHKTKRFGATLLQGADYTGEKIADLLGITGPKYAYEIEQHRKDVERKAKEQQTEKENTWKISKEQIEKPITEPPSLN